MMPSTGTSSWVTDFTDAPEPRSGAPGSPEPNTVSHRTTTDPVSSVASSRAFYSPIGASSGYPDRHSSNVHPFEADDDALDAHTVVTQAALREGQQRGTNPQASVGNQLPLGHANPGDVEVQEEGHSSNPLLSVLTTSLRFTWRVWKRSFRWCIAVLSGRGNRRHKRGGRGPRGHRRK